MTVHSTSTQPSGFTIKFLFVGAIGGALLAAALLVNEVYQAAHVSARVAHDYRIFSRLFTVGKALDTYYLVHGHYPPAQIVDDDGTPIHSWRGILLPFIRDDNVIYRLDEPWDGPNNSLLEDRAPALLRRGSDLYERHKWTDVVALVGPHGLLQENEEVTSLAKRGEQIIKLVHIPQGLVRWLEPRDLPFRSPNGSAVEPTVHKPFIGLPDDPVVLFADNKYFRIRRDVDLAALGDWTRNELIENGVIYVGTPSVRYSSRSRAILLFLTIACVICIVVAFLARRALRKARTNGAQCSVP